MNGGIRRAFLFDRIIGAYETIVDRPAPPLTEKDILRTLEKEDHPIVYRGADLLTTGHSVEAFVETRAVSQKHEHQLLVAIVLVARARGWEAPRT